MLLFLFQHLVVWWIDQVIVHLKFILNLTLMLVFALSFSWRLTHVVLCLLGRSWMNLIFTLFLGNNRKYRPVYTKTISSWVRNVLRIAKAHMSPSTLQCGAVSVALAAGVSLVSILQAGDWPRVSTQARYYFLHTSMLCISTRILFSMLSWASVHIQLASKFQTLTCIKSCRYSFSIIHVVLALDSWHFCPGEQGPTAQHLPLIVCLIWLHWVRGRVPPCGRGVP